MEHKDCFANRSSICSALKKKICKTGGCPFYKPETGETNRQKIENQILIYSSIRGVYKVRNHQYYE